MQVRVECYSGYKADQRPLRFYLRDVPFDILEIEDQWYGPRDEYFRVRAADGNRYILRRSLEPNQDLWTLQACRASRGPGSSGL
mgnify:CR=1 FL=1